MFVDLSELPHGYPAKPRYNVHRVGQRCQTALMRCLQIIAHVIKLFELIESKDLIAWLIVGQYLSIRSSYLAAYLGN